MPLVPPPPPPPPPHKAQYRSKGKARLIKPVEYLSNSKHTMKKILVIGASFVCISVSSFRFQFPFPVSISSFRFISVSCFSICPISTLNYKTHRVVDIKTSKPGHHQKGSHHWTDIISILTKVNFFMRISQYLQPFQVTP